MKSIVLLCWLLILIGVLILGSALSVSCSNRNPLSPKPIQEGSVRKAKDTTGTCDYSNQNCGMPLSGPCGCFVSNSNCVNIFLICPSLTPVLTAIPTITNTPTGTITPPTATPTATVPTSTPTPKVPTATPTITWTPSFTPSPIFTPTPNQTVCEGCETTYEEREKEIAQETADDTLQNSLTCSNFCLGIEYCEERCEESFEALDVATALAKSLAAYVVREQCWNENGCGLETFSFIYKQKITKNV